MRGDRRRAFAARLGFLWILAAGCASVAQAGAPPASCQQNGCSLTSDILVFAQGDATHEIDARITFCDSCVAQAGGGFLLHGDAEVDFGPYDPSSTCSPGDETVHLFLVDAHLQPGAPGGPGGEEDTYVPFNSGEVFPLDPPTPELQSRCVTSGRLDYRIPFVKLTGAEGARTGESALGESHAYLVLPESVRGENAGGLTRTVQLPGGFRLPQDLTVSVSETRTDLMLWPDGMPFKLGPYMLDYGEQQVSFTTDASAGPAPYTPNPPASPDLTPAQVISCDPGKPDSGTDPCTTQTVSNSAYFDHPLWAPGAVASFDEAGMTLGLDLPLGSSIVYQPLFPAGTWLEVTGPASVSIVDGEITGGTFNGGSGWLRVNEDVCAVGPRERTFSLRGGADKPRIGSGGSVLAGVEDLNPLDGGMSPQPLDWGVSNVTDLGCGSLYVPPALPGTTGPQGSWARSAVPTVFDRGIYPGFNYNRDRTCHDVAMTPLAKLCVVDADCDTTAGETCQDGGFSPLCPAPASIPTWNTRIEDVPKTFSIDPAVATPDNGHEMAFVARMSGVTGVFDAGDTFFPITTPAVPGTDLGFDTYGLAYRYSRSNVDTITRGSVIFPWPANTTVPFVDMTFCDCGYLDEGHAPDVLIENTLDYWHAKFSPYAIKFTDQPVTTADCADPHLDGDCSPSQSVILEAVTPVPRFEPDPVTCFTMDSTGDIGAFVPLSGPRVEFDRDKVNLQEPYVFDLEQFELNSWTSAGSPPSAPPYGYYDVSGDLGVPYFGLSSAGIQVRPEDRSGTFYYPADLHQRGNLANSFITVQREAAAGTLVLPFKLDYFGPEQTADPGDGTDQNHAGRGELHAFSEEVDHGLGAANVAAGVILEPGKACDMDLGMTAGMRQWGSVEAADRSRLDNIMDSAHTGPYQAEYEQALSDVQQDTGNPPWDLGPAQDLAMDAAEQDAMQDHPHAAIEANLGATPSSASLEGTRCAGWVDTGPSCDTFKAARVTCDWQATAPSGCPLFAARDLELQVLRHVQQDRQAIMELSRSEERRIGNGDAPSAGAGGGAPANAMSMPGEQDIPFDEDSGLGQGGGAPSGMHTTLHYDVDTNQNPPSHAFEGMSGGVDLGAGGMSGLTFSNLSATMSFFDDGDQFFEAYPKLRWKNFESSGAVLQGHLEDTAPLDNADPDVVDYLGNITSFHGAYQKTSVQAQITDISCEFSIGGGVSAAGWSLCTRNGFSQAGKVHGFLNGEALCFLSVRGEMTLIGGRHDGRFKTQGDFWLAGGVGFCEPAEWDHRSDVFEDDFCLACVLDTQLTGFFPPADLDLTLEGPDVECSGPF